MNPAKNSEQPTAAPAYENRVTVTGYLGRDPEVLEGRAVLSLATKKSWKPQGSDQWQSRTDWHRIVAWGPLAEIARSLAKGDHVSIEGELRTNQYERDLQVNGGDVVTVTIKTSEIRAWSIGLVAMKKPVAKPEAVPA